MLLVSITVCSDRTNHKFFFVANDRQQMEHEEASLSETADVSPSTRSNTTEETTSSSSYLVKTDIGDETTKQSRTNIFQSTITKEELEQRIRNMPPPDHTRLYDNAFLKDRMSMMSLANCLYYRAQKYKTAEEAKVELYFEFEQLFVSCPGLADAALTGTLYSGQIGQVVSAFQQAQGNPDKIYSNMKNWEDQRATEGVQAIEKYKKSIAEQAKAQQNINDIINRHQQASSTSKKS